MLFYLKPFALTKNDIINTIQRNKNIKFVSLSAVDLGNNHTDEKIPIRYLTENYDEFMSKGIQTDGSSVFLPEIANINNAKVDLIPDPDVKWFVDYNYNHMDIDTNKPVGTLVIPSFLRHDGKYVCSRSILKSATNRFKNELKNLLNTNSSIRENLHIGKDILVEDILLTAATELEFWVRSPGMNPNIISLSSSETLKEHYWKRTIGSVRTAMEKALLEMDNFGLSAEMGHKEVGGVGAKLTSKNDYSFVMEQLELDWKYDSAIQTADNEVFVKDLVEDIFVREGLEVTFKAKPIEKVAGNGEHHHMGVVAKLSDDTTINVFAPFDSKCDFLSIVGYSSLMGILKNYEVISPFVSTNNDAFRRLIPGFEAPVSIVTSLGRSFENPARNRTVLVDLISDKTNPLATRFELRSPNPNSNSFLLMAATYQCMLDGIKYAVKSSKTSHNLLDELNKSYGEDSDYLEKNREYVSTLNIFEDLTAEQRNKLYGTPPRTVYDNIELMKNSVGKLSALKDAGVFTDKIISSFIATSYDKWINELEYRIIVDAKLKVKKYIKIHNDENIKLLDPYTIKLWQSIVEKKRELLNSYGEDSMLHEIEYAIWNKDYEKVSNLQVKIVDTLIELELLYSKYELSIYM